MPPLEKPLLSLCMIARNSASCIHRALASAKPAVDEIIVVDTGSTDATPEIARDLGASVLHTTWNDDFSEVRNICLRAASGSWILILDSDEWFLPPDLEALLALKNQLRSLPPTPLRAFRLLNRSLPSDGIGSGTAAHLTRLIPNHPKIRFEFPIHEQAETSLLRENALISDTPIEIQHDGYADPKTRIQKQERNLQILLKQIASEPSHPMTRFLLAGCYMDLNRIEEALDAYLVAFEASFKAEVTTVSNASLVRIVSCLFRLNRFQEAIRFCEQSTGPAAAHPELMIHHAKSLAAMGRATEANQVMENVLLLREEPRIPPCDHGVAMLEAMRWTTESALRSRLSPRPP